MYLKRITIVGFKSFASKTVLNLEPGMTAVVGPNGSGKSNIADAIRWALGEQSKGRLRLGDREEVVFAGSDKRARASLAEVVLLFDNEAGVFPLDLTEVEISRRLYRSGETEYRLAGRPVKLGDLQQLLAEAGFGVGSYAVIGQGTIDSLLLSSPAERKLLFDEAAGIRGAELSREASLRKLAATEANLVRLRDIAAELAPRAAALERSKEAAVELERLEQRVTNLRSSIVATAEAETSEQMQAITAELAELEHTRHRLQQEQTQLEKQQTEQLVAAATAEAAIAEQRDSVVKLEAARDNAAKKLGAAQANLNLAEHSTTSAIDLTRRDKALAKALADLVAETAETHDELLANRSLAKRARTAIETAAAGVTSAQNELLAIRQQLTDGTRQQYVGHALALVKTMARQLDASHADMAELRLLVHKTGRLLSHASRTGEAELVLQLKSAQTKLEAAMTKRETAAEHLTNLTLSARSLELDQARQQQERTHVEQEIQQVQAQLAAAHQQRDQVAALRQAVAAAGDELEALTSQLDQARSQASASTAAPASLVAQLAVRLERGRAELSQVDHRLASLQAQRQQVEVRRDSYRQLSQTWQVGPGNVDARPLSELEPLLVRLEGELEARIQLNHDQKAEYDEVTTRQSDLVTQIADLEAAKTDLESMVTKLAAVVQERFKANFERLDAEFSRQAARLFEGGSASLSLSEDEAGQYGIQIKVSPKGKRLASLAALSGGERAMAGVALLAAILTVNPSPFVVLDEIDAALDDANSGRLADIMHELAARSQLIVITHNRQTMQAAAVLFGVTMNEHHVSHLLSLHLEQATQLAAR